MTLFKNKKRGKHTLLLLRSPLQAYLGYNIVRQSALPNPLVVYISLAPSEKELRYYSLIRSISSDGVFLQLGKNQFMGLLKEWRKVFTIFQWMLGRKITLVVLANVWLWCFRVLAKWSRAPVATMDDGSLNFSPEAQFEWLKKRDQRLLLSRLLFGYSTEEICRQAVRHYTLSLELYHSFGPEPILIRLMQSSKRENEDASINIFLGQPFESAYNQEVTEQFLRAYERIGGIYFPHPREVERPFETVDSPMIIEEYVASEERHVRVFGLFSTALITIQGAEKFYFDFEGNREKRQIMERAGCKILSSSGIADLSFLS